MSTYSAPWNTPSQPVEAPVEPVYVAPIVEVVEEVAPPVVKKKKAEPTDVTESELPSE